MHSALVVVDAQVNMWEAPLHAGAAILERLRELVAEARQHQALVVFVRNLGTPGEVDALGAPGFPIHPTLAPRLGELVVDKQTPDAFVGTDLGPTLLRSGVSRVVIAGMQSERCIEATCRGAKSLGFEVLLARGAHSTFDGSIPATAQIALTERTLAGIATFEEWNRITF
jgi:nicotinamidase-related amidase